MFVRCLRNKVFKRCFKTESHEKKFVFVGLIVLVCFDGMSRRAEKCT